MLIDEQVKINREHERIWKRFENKQAIKLNIFQSTVDKSNAEQGKQYKNACNRRKQRMKDRTNAENGAKNISKHK